MPSTSNARSEEEERLSEITLSPRLRSSGLSPKALLTQNLNLPPSFRTLADQVDQLAKELLEGANKGQEAPLHHVATRHPLEFVLASKLDELALEIIAATTQQEVDTSWFFSLEPFLSDLSSLPRCSQQAKSDYRAKEKSVLYYSSNIFDAFLQSLLLEQRLQLKLATYEKSRSLQGLQELDRTILSLALRILEEGVPLHLSRKRKFTSLDPSLLKSLQPLRSLAFEPLRTRDDALWGSYTKSPRSLITLFDKEQLRVMALCHILGRDLLNCKELEELSAAF